MWPLSTLPAVQGVGHAAMHDLLALLSETRCFISPTSYETFQARRHLKASKHRSHCIWPQPQAEAELVRTRSGPAVQQVT